MGSSTISLGLGLGGGKAATSSGRPAGGGAFANQYSVSFDGSDDFASVNGDSKSIELPENSLGFTYCQVPIIYQLAEVNTIVVEYANGKNKSFEGLSLDSYVSQSVFTRNSEVEYIRVHIHPSILK